MVRDPDLILARHQQRHRSSEGASLIELMLKLLAVDVPDLQHLGEASSTHWNRLVDQVFGRYAVRRFEGDQAGLQDLLKEEVAAGRPVGMVLKNPSALSNLSGGRAWIAIRVSQVPPYLFVDLVSKMIEQGGGEGHFTEKRVLRLDMISAHEISEVLYCEELFPGPAPVRRGRRPASLQAA